MIDGALVRWNWDVEGFLFALASKLEEENYFGQFATAMKRDVAKAKAVPGSWIATTQGAIKCRVELGGVSIQVEIGIVDTLPHHQMMQAFIMNTGSGPVHSVAGSYLNVHTGGFEKGLGIAGIPRPYFDKVGVHWFDKQEARAIAQAQNIVNKAARATLREFRPELQGKKATVVLKV